MATTSLVLGILSVPCLSILAGIPAIVLGHLARKRARTMPGQYGGAGFALAGLVLGYVSLGLAAVYVVVWAPALARISSRAQSISCASHLKMITIGFRLFATDNQDVFPFNLSTNQSGTFEFCLPGPDGYDQNAYRHFQVLSNELGSPKVLVCPADKTKHAASSFRDLQALNVSYLLRSGTNIDESHPQEILIRCPIHGNIGLCDGSVQRPRERP